MCHSLVWFSRGANETDPNMQITTNPTVYDVTALSCVYLSQHHDSVTETKIRDAFNLGPLSGFLRIKSKKLYFGRSIGLLLLCHSLIVFFPHSTIPIIFT